MRILKPTIIFLCSVLIILAASYGDQSPEKKKKSPYPEQQAKFAIDVRYYLLDLLAYSEDGEHITDLEIDDFDLYINDKKVEIASLDRYNYIDIEYLKRLNQTEDLGVTRGLINEVEESIIDDDGFERDISVKPEASLSGKKPLRTFIIVFANLPLLPKRWFLLRDGLIDYIENSMSDNVQIAVYSMGLRKIGLMHPMTTDKAKIIQTIRTYLSSRWRYNKEENYDDGIKRKYDLDDEPLDFFLMADAPSSEIDHSNSSWIISGLDLMTIQKDTVYALFKQFDALINKLREIPGRKNLLLFSEGFPYITSNLSEYIEMRNRKRKIVNRFNRYNIAIYTFDMFTARNLYAANLRAGLLSDLSAATNGAFYRFLGNSSRKIGDRLKGMDFSTANYYVIGFYLGGIDLSERADVEVKVKRNDIRLFYAKALIGKEIITQPEKYLKEMEITKKLFDNRSYSDLAITNGVSFVPGYDNKTWTTFSFRFPYTEMTKTQEDNVSDELDAQLLLEISSDELKSKYYALKEIEYEYEDKPSKTITYNYRILLEPGNYHVRSLLHSKTNGKNVTANIEMLVPDYQSEDHQLALVLVPNDGRGPNALILNKIREPDENTNFSDPFTYGTAHIIPSVTPGFTTGEKLVYYLYYKYEKGVSPLFKVAYDDGKTEFFVEYEQHPPVPFLGNYYVQRFEFVLPSSLEPGQYKLIAELPKPSGQSTFVDFMIREKMSDL